MLRELRIQNFKGWKDTGKIRMAPITLFFGANSSGKSSIGQFLMMLKQTAESPDRKAVFYPGGKNTAVQLGSYKEMVYHRKPENKISFGYKWDLKDAIWIKDPISRKSFHGSALEFDAQVGLNSNDQSSLILEYAKYNLLDGPNQTLNIGLEKISNLKSEYDVKSDPYQLKRNQGRKWPLKTHVRFYGFPDEVVAYYQNADFVQELNLLHEELFSSISYLGPLRTKTERIYSWPGNEPESVGSSGEGTVAAILSARARKRTIGLGPKRRKLDFEAVIASKLKEMGLIEGFEIMSISNRQEYEVKICTKGSQDMVDLPDVGFGISQVLPVLVQCFYAPPGSIIIMEQPEIHLHPSAQSALADVMIDVIKSKENSQDRNIQLIIETHSEHFLRRLQRRIADDTLSKDSVSAYFADSTKTPAQLEPLQIDLFGNIKNWPDNFFGDEMGDITEQARAAMKKRATHLKTKSED